MFNILKTDFLPINREDLKSNGWDELDIILISGDAYIDHPAFGVPLLGRFLVSHGFRVGIISQPVKDEDYLALGRPRLFFGISSGNVDSMVNHYTAQRKIRSEDDFSPNGITGLRPDRAVMVYTQKIKQLFKGVKVVLGGVEASMRRIPHYDFWSDKVKNSLLFDSKADILVYGNGERQVLEIANRLRDGLELGGVEGTCVISKEIPAGAVELVEISTVANAESFYKMTKIFYENFQTKVLFYKHTNRYLVHYPMAKPLSTEELDEVYNLPFSREIHPKYKGKFIKAFEQIKNSVLSHRGCYGGCSFCIIGFHQGKIIQSRSKESIIKEVSQIAKKKYFKGTITDVAGATANMYGTFCSLELSGGRSDCNRRSCLYPSICKNLQFNEQSYLSVLKATSRVRGVNNVFISSGVRFDLALRQPEFIKELCFFHTSGHLKLAPEHVSENVLSKMNKPSIDKYLQFNGIYHDLCKKLDKKQYILPYLIVGFPGCTMQDAYELHLFLKKNNLHIEQIQEFTPTPMTIATMMYYTGIDFETGERIYVPKGREIREQKALAQWFMKGNRKIVESLGFRV